MSSKTAIWTFTAFAAAGVWAALYLIFKTLFWIVSYA